MSTCFIEFKKEPYLVRSRSRTGLAGESHPPPFSQVEHVRGKRKQSRGARGSPPAQEDWSREEVHL